MRFDVLITGGIVVDGTGKASCRADVGVCGDRIEALGDFSGRSGAREIDATGLVVAPGFIDPHTHAHDEAEGGILVNPRADNMIRQGVTTIIAGNCGGSPWPIGDHLQAVEALSIRQNYGVLVGMGTVRGRDVNEVPMAGPEQISAMRRRVQQAMEEGALGVSTGYFPEQVTTSEIVQVASAVARYGGVYSSHIRNEGDGLLGSVEEIIEIGARAGLPVQVSHIKTYGERNWWKVDGVLELLDRAHRRGVDIMADRYPYAASYTGIGALVPGWAAAYFQDHRQRDRDRVRQAVSDRLALIGGPDRLVFAPETPDPELDGKSLGDYAAERSQDPVDVAIELLERGGVSCIYFALSEENIQTFYRHPLVMGGSDGQLRVFGRGVSHPRNYGTFPRIIGRYGRDKGALGMEEVVKKCTSMAAERWHLKGRGVLAEGNYADIVVFSWRLIADQATFEEQHRYPTGIHWVMVNGGIAVEHGETSEGCFGRVLRR